MNSLIALSVQRRINALDFASVITIILALVSISSVMITALCLIACLFCQALVFRCYFKYIKDTFRMAKRILLIVGNFALIILLLLKSNLI